LISAAKHGDFDTAAIVLASGANIVAEAVIEAAYHNQLLMVVALIKRHYKLERSYSGWSYALDTGLYDAVCCHGPALAIAVIHLREWHLRVHCIDTLLYRAAVCNNLEVMFVAIAYGAQAFESATVGAAMQGNVAAALLATSHSPWYNQSFWMKPVRNSSVLKCVDTLLELGAMIAPCRYELAAGQGNVAIMQWLWEHGDQQLISRGRALVHASVHSDGEPAIRHLLAMGVRPSTIVYARVGSWASIELLDQMHLVNPADQSALDILVECAGLRKDGDLMVWALDKGASRSQSTMHRAIRHGLLAPMRWMVAHGYVYQRKDLDVAVAESRIVAIAEICAAGNGNMDLEAAYTELSAKRLPGIECALKVLEEWTIHGSTQQAAVHGKIARVSE
jgi:hypothetical protein